jgi:hypothetical protein
MRIEDRVDPEAMDMALLLEHQITLAILMAGYAICEVETKATLYADLENTFEFCRFNILNHSIKLSVGDENTGKFETRFLMNLSYEPTGDIYDYVIEFKILNRPPTEAPLLREFRNIRISQQQGEVLANETTIWLKEQLLNLLVSRN